MLAYIAAVIFFIIAVSYLLRPALMLLFATIGFILLPEVHRLVERIFRFRFTPRIKIAFGIFLLAVTMPTVFYYHQVDSRQAAKEKVARQIILQKEEQENAIEAAKLKQQHDSLDYYLRQSRLLIKAQKNEDALGILTRAGSFAITTGDRDKITAERIEIRQLRISECLKKGQYKTAIPELDEMLEMKPGDDDLRYKRALCYSKAGQIENAVADLKIAMEQGNDDAITLHEKINPLRKRVLYYLTRCCDGTESPTNAKGRGACSHHGGVCDWNEPVYKEYRKY